MLGGGGVGMWAGGVGRGTGVFEFTSVFNMHVGEVVPERDADVARRADDVHVPNLWIVARCVAHRPARRSARVPALTPPRQHLPVEMRVEDAPAEIGVRFGVDRRDGCFHTQECRSGLGGMRV